MINCLHHFISMARARVFFKGKVQGVWFRANCQKKALELGLVGWVRNLPDGNVESIIEGPRSLIVDFIDWNRSSQPFARVRDMDIEWETEKGDLDTFSVIR